MAQNQGGTVELGQHIGDGEGLARSCDTQQRLRTVTTLQTLHKLLDGLWLVASRLEIRYQLKVHVSR